MHRGSLCASASAFPAPRRSPLLQAAGGGAMLAAPACETPAMRTLYPAIEPYREFTLPVSDQHT
ncbi:hypothetical protein DD607_30800, partial [Salmonella sp. 3DZ2-4SM]